MSGTPTAVDQSSADSPRWPRLVVVCALLPLGIVGALALSAAATIDLARRHGVPVEVQPAAVAMLEVVSTAGTLLAIFAGTTRLRRRALAAVVGASGVALVAGVSAYGWFGAVAPIGLVGLVHLAAEAWQELRTERRAQLVEHAPAPAAPVVPVDAPATSVEPVVEVVDAPTVSVDLDALGPVHGPRTLVETARELLACDDPPGDRSLARELDVTRHRARQLAIEARTGLAEVAS